MSLSLSARAGGRTAPANGSPAFPSLDKGPVESTTQTGCMIGHGCPSRRENAPLTSPILFPVRVPFAPAVLCPFQGCPSDAFTLNDGPGRTIFEMK
jgi:hypothetical protein